MGWYINPPEQTKEEWLQDNGDFFGFEVPKNHFVNDKVAVCLIGNAGFTAAAIAVDKSEFMAFQQEDGRPKLWFMVSVDKLKPYLDGKVVV